MGPLARSVDPDARHQDPADRVARALLAQEFAVFPRSPQPPIPVLQAISKCLDDVSLSVRSARSLGFLPPSMTANPSAESAALVSFRSSSLSGQGRSRSGPKGYRQKQRRRRYTGRPERRWLWHQPTLSLCRRQPRIQPPITPDAAISPSSPAKIFSSCSYTILQPLTGTLHGIVSLTCVISE